MKLFITGSQGFIGKLLTESLLDLGYEIIGIDLLMNSVDHEKYIHIQGNIMDSSLLSNSMSTSIDAVIHLAAEHKDFGVSEEEYFTVNEHGTKVILDCATEAGIEKIIFFSSVAVYGKIEKATETTAPTPSTSYGASKLAAENIIRQWIKVDSKRSAVIIRPAVVFGPENYANIYRLISRVCDGKFFWVGKGENIKSVAYVENLVSATLFLLESMKIGIEIYNYSDEPQLSLKELVNVVSQVALVKLPDFHIPPKIAIYIGGVIDVIGKLLRLNFSFKKERFKRFSTSSHYPSDKIRLIGFKQKIDLSEGISKTVDWYLESKAKQ